MAAASLSSLALASSGHRSFTHPNRPHIRISPRNPSSWRSPFLLHAEQGQRATMEQQESSKYEKKKDFFHADEDTPAIVSYTSTKDDGYMADTATLHFSTFNSDVALLKQFSKPVNLREPFALSACRDLLLLMDENSFLCNIATQELINLPPVRYGYGTPWTMGFGYVPSTKEFKVLARVLSTNKFKILTLGADRWRDVEDPPVFVQSHHIGVFLNGAIHLRSARGDGITTFDLEREEWGSIPPPPVPSPSIRCFSMRELSGHLCMLVDTCAVSFMEIWSLKDYHNGFWVKHCTIRFSALHPHRDLFHVRPLGIEDDGRILLQVNSYRLELYDPKTKTSREIHRFEELVNERDRRYVKVFSSLGIGDRFNSVTHSEK